MCVCERQDSLLKKKEKEKEKKKLRQQERGWFFLHAFYAVMARGAVGGGLG